MRVSSIVLSLAYVLMGMSLLHGQEKSRLEMPSEKIDFGMVEVDGENFSVTVLSTEFETSEQTYTVSVPYQETVGNKTVTRMRREARTRTVKVPKMITEQMSVPAEAISFSSLASAKRITNVASVKKALAKPRAAVITYTSKPLGSYYRQVLNPSIVVLHIDRDKLIAQSPVAPVPSATDDSFGTPSATTTPVVDDLFKAPQPQRARLLGATIDCSEIVFQPETWKAKTQSTLLYPWEGDEVVFLTTSAQFDSKLMRNWVKKLDQGWQLYANLTGARPQPFKQFNGKPTIVAVPSDEFTCGAGCGYVGSTGVELAMFYSHNYPALQKRPNAIPHYVFYEMGRNFYTFEDRHSCFTTGFAVFMRYVCMDSLECEDIEPQLRTIIDNVEKRFANSDLDFLELFTNVRGTGEKGNRIRNERGTLIIPSDQPVTYASAMLRLRRDFGGDVWVKRFFAALKDAPTASDKTEDGALRQCYAWLVCSSLAAKKNLSPIFCEQWHMRLSTNQRTFLRQVDWGNPNRSVREIVDQLAALQ